MKVFVQRCLGLTGYRLQRRYPRDLSPHTLQTLRRVEPYTLTSPEGVAATCAAVEYVVRGNVPGAIVECGVWRGGSAMAIALTLLRLGAGDRDIYLFDTFAGMTEPTEHDIRADGLRAVDVYRHAGQGEVNEWAGAPVTEVGDRLLSTNYQPGRLHLVVGRVEETVPDRAPAEIALLRLDTDWYESTRHELVHLYPRLVEGGVLILDDYGLWQGARKAADEYFDAEDESLLLCRIDPPTRVAVKQARRTQATAPRDPEGGASS